MKRLLAITLILCLALTFVGCGKDKDKKDTKPAHSIDVEYYAKLGQIPECKYTLGADAKEMQKEFEAEDKAHEENADGIHSHSVFSLMEMDDFSFLSYENASYYFKNDDKEVYSIVSFDNSYGFEIGDMDVEIKDALSKYEVKEKQGDKDSIFFLPAAESYTYLEYVFGEKTVRFVFQNNALCAVALIK